MLGFLSFKRAKKKAMVFVDYESWFYSYRTLFNLYPDPRAFRAKLEEKYEIVDIMVFGDFSSAVMADELVRVRSITNTIIETGNTFNRRKKDMTDFIMLDYIYQFADENRKIDTYIIFTGDGHFQSVTKYLVQKKKKRVIIYGVKDSISRQLREAATDVKELPNDSELKQRYYKLIVDNLEYAYNHPDIIPTFKSTVDVISSRYNVNADDIKSTLSEMIEKGYIKKTLRSVEFKRQVKVLAAQWDKLRADGLWEMPEQKNMQIT